MMQAAGRRVFLKWAGVAGCGLLVSPRGWALNKLVPVEPLGRDHAYRAWEDLYRDEWVWDTIGNAAHCSNCAGNCAFKVFVKDGLVLREEQLASYPRTNDRVPDPNPRGCQKGAVHSDAMYSRAWSRPSRAVTRWTGSACGPPSKPCAQRP